MKSLEIIDDLLFDFLDDAIDESATFISKGEIQQIKQDLEVLEIIKKHLEVYIWQNIFSKEHGLLSPIYETSFRGGCWFCPKQSMKQLKWLYQNHRDLWNILKGMEKDSHNTFKPNYTLQQLEDKFNEGE